MSRRQSSFERAADGSMTLIEHIRELRTRLFRACIAIVVGTVVGYLVSRPVQSFIVRPYCDFSLSHGATKCSFNLNGPLDQFMLQLKISLYVGLVLSAPFWL